MCPVVEVRCVAFVAGTVIVETVGATSGGRARGGWGRLPENVKSCGA